MRSTRFFNYNIFRIVKLLSICFFLTLIIIENLTTLEHVDFRLPLYLRKLTQSIGISQNWGLFAPRPYKDDGWYIIPGELESGKKIDVFTNKKISWVKPYRVSSTFKNHRWRKYMRNLYLLANKGHRLYYGKCLCINWNNSHEDKLLKFKIYYMREVTLPDNETSVPEELLLWEHYCYE